MAYTAPCVPNKLSASSIMTSCAGAHRHLWLWSQGGGGAPWQPSPASMPAIFIHKSACMITALLGHQHQTSWVHSLKLLLSVI